MPAPLIAQIGNSNKCIIFTNEVLHDGTNDHVGTSLVHSGIFSIETTTNLIKLNASNLLKSITRITDETKIEKCVLDNIPSS